MFLEEKPDFYALAVRTREAYKPFEKRAAAQSAAGDKNGAKATRAQSPSAILVDLIKAHLLQLHPKKDHAMLRNLAMGERLRERGFPISYDLEEAHDAVIKFLNEARRANTIESLEALLEYLWDDHNESAVKFIGTLWSIDPDTDIPMSVLLRTRNARELLLRRFAETATKGPLSSLEITASDRKLKRDLL